jgi:hypothetical protein
MDRRKAFGASVKFAVRSREYHEVLAEWERKQRAGETVTIFRSEADEIRARFKTTDELWNQIQTLYKQSGSRRKTGAAARDDQSFGRCLVLLERLNDLQRANIRQFRTFLARPASKPKNVR